MTQKLLPLTGDVRYCAVIKLTDDLVAAVESGAASSGLSLKIGKGKHVLKLADKEFPLFVSEERNHVAYQCVDDVLQEVGSVEQKVVVKPHPGSTIGKKRRDKEQTSKKKKVSAAEPSLKRKSDSLKPSVSKKPRSNPTLKAAGPAKTSTDRTISATNKLQRVMHVLAIKPTGLSQLKTHALLKRLSKEELGRIARSIADLGQGGKYTLRKAKYRELDPNYSLIDSAELEMIKCNIVTKGDLELSQCVPLREEMSPTADRATSPGLKARVASSSLANKLDKVAADKSKATKEARLKKLELTAAQDKAREAAAGILSKQKGGGAPTPLVMSLSRQSELKELEVQLKRQKEVSTLAEYEELKLEFRDIYPQYKKMDDNLENNETEFRRLRQELENSREMPRKRSIENQINSRYEEKLDEIQGDLHKYRCLHTQLQHLKRQIKQWEQKRARSGML